MSAASACLVRVLDPEDLAGAPAFEGAAQAAGATLEPGTYAAKLDNLETGATWDGELVVVSPSFAHFYPVALEGS